MMKLIQGIKDQKLSIIELTNRVDNTFNKSYELREKLIPDLNERYCAISDYHKKMFDMGESSPETRWWYELHFSVEKFTEMMREDNWRKEEKEFHDYMLSKARLIFEMEETKYQYRAYKKVLEDKLGMMDYNYNHKREDWI